MIMQKLYENQLTCELELNHRVETTTIETRKKDKGVALKATEFSSKARMEDDSDIEDDDNNLTLLARRFRKFMRKSRSNNYKRTNNNNNNQRRDSSKDLCYNCKKPDHYIVECDKPLREELRIDKKKEYAKKDKKAYKKFQKKDNGLVAEGS